MSFWSVLFWAIAAYIGYVIGVFLLSIIAFTIIVCFLLWIEHKSHVGKSK